ncbi:ATP-BINDING CASSETTE SUB-FAMILY B [Salix koriyanagi]|uniref:ATP-BINDING CASSETTE SUB-FAMILY B n=1 Tax=Salix koriyanagi TaxID=2511006 RepID=A0A9Q0ZUQ6_9ROSI|nr:ATP-BINDING CASSETTE SUB-FAMILY B [Salix koriyanagi]
MWYGSKLVLEKDYDGGKTITVIMEIMIGGIYPTRPDIQIFSEFSLQAPSGTTAALVGQSGSGKSTVISLVERFYDPDSGQVLIDDVDPILFAISIQENIACFYYAPRTVRGDAKSYYPGHPPSKESCSILPSSHHENI